MSSIHHPLGDKSDTALPATRACVIGAYFLTPKKDRQKNMRRGADTSHMLSSLPSFFQTDLPNNLQENEQEGNYNPAQELSRSPLQEYSFQKHSFPEHSFQERSHDARMSEALGLAEAISLDIIFHKLFLLSKIQSKTYIGSGQVSLLKEEIKANHITLVIMDCALSPAQQRNLERAFQAKVIDRTGLILEIFGQRAKSKEGVLQVELAHLLYQKSRLVRSWTHLERQRGSLGFIGGPGETQIEMDRRLIQERVHRIRLELEKVKKTRRLHRHERQKIPYTTVALVGYTNSGKSTLFNHLTQAQAYVKDQLFATLDPSIRNVLLPSGAKIMLSDTVGFVSDLPHVLVEAFHATLEEVITASIILHVRDITHPDTEAQQQDVLDILTILQQQRESDSEQNTPFETFHLIEIWNKIDLFTEEQQTALLYQLERERDKNPQCHYVAVSALTGAGSAELLQIIDNLLRARKKYIEILVSQNEGAKIHWLYKEGQVVLREEREGNNILLRVFLSSSQLAQAYHSFPDLILLN